MDSVTAGLTIRDNLRTNLTDPYTTAGGSRGTGVQWIYYNEPILSAKYPIVELKKVDNPSVPIDIGSNYMEYEQLFLNIWFSTKNGFKINVSGTEYVNSQLVEYYQGLIKSTLKAQFDTLHDAGAKMYKHVNTSPIEFDKETQLYFGSVTIRVSYFNR